MIKPILLVALCMLTSACGPGVADWERTPGPKTPPLSEQTKYLCVTAEYGAMVLIDGRYEIIPKGTKLVDTGRRALTKAWAIAYYKGHAVDVAWDAVEECE